MIRVLCSVLWMFFLVQEFCGKPEVCSEKVVTDALTAYNQELLNLRARKSAGIDKSVENFTSLVPGAVHQTDAHLLDANIIEQSRILNRIAAAIRQESPATSLSAIIEQYRGQDNIDCPFKKPSCGTQPAKFRTADGRCNNRLNPLWGAAQTPFVRELEAVYGSDSKGTPPRYDFPKRHGVAGTLLPSPRLVSNIVHANSDSPKDATVTNLFTVFGQSLSHEISDTPSETGIDGTILGCLDQSKPTHRCFNIKIPTDDAFFKAFGRTSMGFARSRETTDITCSKGLREQINIVSSFVDLSQVYGPNEKYAQMLKGEDGLLKTSIPNTLPFQKNPNKLAFEHGFNLLLSGDEKGNVYSLLLALNTLYVREHNRIAKKLRDLLGDKPDAIYQTARQILIAAVQHITYSEYLPLVIGKDRMTKYGLNPLKTGYYKAYNSSVNPALTNVFATAAMRFGHSMVREKFGLQGVSYPSASTLRLKEVFFRSNFYLKYEEGIVGGVLADKSEKCDRHVVRDLRNNMFETKPGNGGDLAAFNIQRGRDHGLPSYNEYRKHMSLSGASVWTVDSTSGGFGDMTEEVVKKLKAVYSSPQDVDVWTGGVSETPVDGAQVGPLFAEIIARQFQKLRKGDYYWYENGSNGFTPGQLQEIRKYSLAKMICFNFAVDKIQPNVFKPKESTGNCQVECKQMDDMDFNLWKTN